MESDFLIIGSGIAGLRAAIDLAPHGRVLILTKADPTESNTGYAQGGIAAAVGPEDSPEEHFADTVAAGAGLCQEDAVRVLVEDGVTYVHQLVDWGVQFDRDRTGALALGREAAHRVRRVLHARDATGREIGRLLWSRVAGDQRVRVLNNTRAIELLLRNGVCAGARFSKGRDEQTVRAKAVLIATGGAGQIFSETTNPPIATGDGIALAWYAGARVTDLEFVQFHPTALAVPGAPRFLLSEALRGEGAWLVNDTDERFMSRYEPAGELAARDLVSRAIVKEIARTNSPVYLTLQHLDADWVHARFPTITAACQAVGLDLARDRIPVGPAAHYMMGGVETDVWARTSLPALYAAGEVACTGVHGANRLASNSLLEGLVFGARAAHAMIESPRAGTMFSELVGRSEDRPPQVTSGTTQSPVEAGLSASDRQIQSLMWRSVGLVREAESLRRAIAEMDVMRDHPSLATVAWLVANAALRREESRGGHYRSDFPARDDVHWRFHLSQQRHG